MDNELPRVIGILLCERILQDIMRHDAVSCINIHNGIIVQTFPAVIPLVYAFAQLSGSHSEFNYQFKITDRSNQIITTTPITPVEPLPNRFMTHKIISAMTGLTFKEEGLYHICLSLDGQDVASSPFQVMQITPES
jgi:hypothetical protein